jgi:cob(I)alamin adenosyltransferase
MPDPNTDGRRIVRIDRVATRGGDGGETSLGDGARVGKDTARIAAMGAVDEANAAISLLRLHTRDRAEIDAELGRIQHDLFDLGADLCVPGTDDGRMRLAEAPLLRLDGAIAAWNGRLPALSSFVLPGGSAGAAQAHMARTITRRAERDVVALARVEALNPLLVRYLNRLSDLLFVLARVLNDNGAADVLWRPAGSGPA